MLIKREYLSSEFKLKGTTRIIWNNLELHNNYKTKLAGKQILWLFSGRICLALVQLTFDDEAGTSMDFIIVVEYTR